MEKCFIEIGQSVAEVAKFLHMYIDPTIIFFYVYVTYHMYIHYVLHDMLIYLYYYDH